MKKALFFLLIANATSAQNLSISANAGYSVPNHPKFTPITTAAYSGMLGYTNSSAHTSWGKYIGTPDYLVAVSAESLGNPAVLGNAFGVMPCLVFGKNTHWQFEFGLGAAYLDKTYDPFTNPNNTVLGSPVSFFGHTVLAYRPVLKLPIWVGLQVNHYSNGSVAQPNLGANTASLGVRWERVNTLVLANDKNTENIVNKNEENIVATNIAAKTKTVAANFRTSLGITERGLDGPKYLAYTISADASRRFGTVHKVCVGAEYIFSESPYMFMRYSGFSATEAQQQAQRFVVYVGYELLLGYVGIVGEGGFYLNKHFAQNSIISTKIGANLYFKNIIKKPNGFSPYMGVYVRGYFGQADFMEMAVGTRF